MHRQQLEHIIRAIAGITGASEFVIVGSQAVLGQFPQAPDELLISIEADVFSLRDPADNDLIDGSIAAAIGGMEAHYREHQQRNGNFPDLYRHQCPGQSDIFSNRFALARKSGLANFKKRGNPFSPTK
jgi:hypothetical protein